MHHEKSFCDFESLKIALFFLFFFYDSFQIFRWFWPYFITYWMFYLSNMIWWFHFRDFFRFPDLFRIFPDFHQIFRFLHKIDSLLLKNYMIFFFSENFSGFRIFSGFFQIFIKSLNSFCFLVYSAHEVL